MDEDCDYGNEDENCGLLMKIFRSFGLPEIMSFMQGDLE